MHSAKPDLLFLAHRIPFPPDKGDKIRSYHLLKHLSERYRIHLGAFIDDPDDWRHADALSDLCHDVRLISLDPFKAKIKSLTGLLTGEALSLPYYRNAEMARWVSDKLRSGLNRSVIYSSVMAQYVMQAPGTRVMDFVDMDSDKWRQYAATKSWPLSWLYGREAIHLLEWERKVASSFDASLFVSAQEATDFSRAAPESLDRVGWYNNGVDADYFSPERAYESPYAAGEIAIAFTGAMDYWPNVDAVQWFASEVLPALLQTHPELVFSIVGSRPTPALQALAGPHIRVTGRVPDVRPWLAHAHVVVAPMRIARGVQNKVLEGMAMARTVVVSPQGLEGLDAHPGDEVLLGKSAAAFADACRAVIAGRNLGAAARQRVIDSYAWEACLRKIDVLLEERRDV
jgi:sugar transferase (PEP-CTERM/EpsH1 system associated)